MFVGVILGRFFLYLFFFLLSQFCLSCSQGGSSESDSFFLLETNFSTGQVRPVNVPLEFRFNQPLDWSSVNSSTVMIEPMGMGIPPVVGEFSLGDEPNVLRFQPLCPADPEGQTGGFLPSSAGQLVKYSISIPQRRSSVESSLLSQQGEGLNDSFESHFQTAMYPGTIVQDSNPSNSPQVKVSSLPGVLGRNLFSNPIGPIEIKIDQQILANSIQEDAIYLQFEDDQYGVIRIPSKVELIRNCTSDGGALLALTPCGILPAGQRIDFYLSSEVSGLGVGDSHFEDLYFHSAWVEDSSLDSKLDALVENFDSSNSVNEDADLLWPKAELEEGVLKAASIFPSDDNGIVIEVGDSTFNGAQVVFSTDFAQLKDQNGNNVSFQEGLLEVRDFILRSPHGAQPTIFSVIGSHPLRIRASGTIRIEEGARLTVNGQAAPNVNGIDQAHTPSAGGKGWAGAGDGGSGSPNTDRSSPTGQAGFGAFQISAMGGQPGHSAFGASQGLRPGGGGGGNWGVEEINSTGEWTSFVYGMYARCQSSDECAPASCESNPPGVFNSKGEPGSSGNRCFQNPAPSSACFDPVDGLGDPICHFDATNSGCLASGGNAGPAIFSDTNPENNFLGRKPKYPQGGRLQIISGELDEIRGGQGGGGGGNAVPGNVFPSGTNFSTNDIRGAGGGGGGGALILEALGEISIDGLVFANGGDGGAPEQDLFHFQGGGGGGGGAGGLIVVESASRLWIGKNARVQARGGNRGLGGGVAPGAEELFLPPFCRMNQSAARGGAGGKGLILFRVPFDDSQTLACGNYNRPRIENNAVVMQLGNGNEFVIDCERELSAAGSMSSEFVDRLDPAPQIVLPTFGPRSSAQSPWFFLGWANDSSTHQFEFAQAQEPVENLNEVFLEPVISGTGAQTEQQGRVVILNSPNLAETIRHSPRVLISDEFQPNPQAPRYSILGASVNGNLVSLTLDIPEQENVQIGSWTLYRRYGKASISEKVNLSLNVCPIRVFFEGARPLWPLVSEPDPATIVGPTAEIETLAGLPLLRFTVHFNQDFAAELTESANLCLDFLKIPVRF